MTPDYPDRDAISQAERTQDAQVMATMRHLLGQMVDTAIEAEALDAERAVDLMLMAAVVTYAEHHVTTPEDIGLFCRAIAEQVLECPDADEPKH